MWWISETPNLNQIYPRGRDMNLIFDWGWLLKTMKNETKSSHSELVATKLQSGLQSSMNTPNTSNTHKADKFKTAGTRSKSRRNKILLINPRHGD